MSLQILRKTKFTCQLLWQAAAPRARQTVGHFMKYLQPGEKILDVGAGLCDITLLLQEAGYRVTPLDVADFSCTPLLHPQVYDGRHMPFTHKQFDTALLLTILHHVPRDLQKQVLCEAARVARRVIIIEDVYTSQLQRLATMGMDSLLNLEFIGHPHSNRTDAGWRAMFKQLGLQLTHEQTFQSFGVLRHRLYVLESPETGKNTVQ